MRSFKERCIPHDSSMTERNGGIVNTATIFDIQRGSLVDGPGIRTTVFFKGCNLRCAWCHNPESQSSQPQMMFYEDMCIGCGKCKEVCQHETCILCDRCELFCLKGARKVCGREYRVDEVVAEVLKDTCYYANSGGGVTCSGGECMLQIDFLLEVLKQCKTHGIHTAVDTAGAVAWESFERIMPYTDLFLYDIKCLDQEKHKQYVGTGNDLILKNLRKLLESGARVWIRIPVIAGVNDDVEEMVKIKAFLKECKEVEKIELLPYHALGEHKYRALEMEPKRFEAPDEDKMRLLRNVFEVDHV